MNKKLESSIYLYLGNRVETDCINIKESMLTECIPIVSNIGLFSDRDYCIKIDGDVEVESTHIAAANQVIKLMKDDEYYKYWINNIQKNKNKIKNWNEIGKEWLNLFV